MTRLPRVTGKAVIRALERAGFTVDRTSGSHYVLVDRSSPERICKATAQNHAKATPRFPHPPRG